MNENKCIICGRDGNNVSLLIHGDQGKCLCNECIRLYNELLNSYSVMKKKDSNFKMLKPHEIKEMLDQYVVGHDLAKKTISMALYNQELIWENKSPENYRKQNMLIIGPTGVGKTYLVETAAKILNIPFVFCDATTFSEVGYVGEDVSKIVDKVLANVDGDVIRAERSIVFIDEVDKIKRIGGVSSSRDVSGEGVQQSLLKMMEGTDVIVSTKDRYGRINEVHINTKNILFVFSGAFSSIDYSNNIDREILKFGMLPEFVGRTPIIVKLGRLKLDQYIDILTGTDFSLLQRYKSLFRVDNIELVIEDDAIEKIATLAVSSEFGARSLFRIVEETLLPLRYDAIKEGKKKIVLRASDIVDE